MMGLSIGLLMEKIVSDFLDVLSDGTTNKVNKKKFKLKFKNAGEQIANLIDMEQDGDDFGQKLALVFSKENIKALYKVCINTKAFSWNQVIRCEMFKVFADYEVNEADISCYVELFLDIVFSVVNEWSPEVASQMFLGQMEEHMEQGFAGVKRDTGQLLTSQADLAQKIDKVLEYAKKNDEKSESKDEEKELQKTPQTELTIETLPAPDITWELKYTHTEGLWGDKDKQLEEIKTLTEQWKAERISYPSWFILPVEYREKLHFNTRNEEFLQTDVVSKKEMFSFAYELVWRYETGMLPWTGYMLHHIQKRWVELDKDERQCLYSEWLFIGFVLLREYRENLEYDAWSNVLSQLKTENLGGEYAADLQIEQLLMDYTMGKFAQVLKRLSRINPSDYAFRHRLKIAEIEVLCGQSDDGTDNLDALISDIEKSLRKPHTSAVYMYQIIASAYRLKAYTFRACTDHWDEEKQSLWREVYNSANKYKKYYSFDKEREYCAVELMEWYEKKEKLPPFELNRETITIIGTDRGTWKAYSFYRVLNLTAMPMRIKNVNALSGLEISFLDALMETHRNLACYLLLRNGNEKCIEPCFTRVRLAEWGRGEIDAVFTYVYTCVRESTHMLVLQSDEEAKWSICKSMVSMGIRILKRLASIASLKQQQQLLELMLLLIDKDVVKEFRVLDGFIVKIMKCVNDKCKAALLSQLLGCSVKERFHIRDDGQTDPFDVLAIHNQTVSFFEKAILAPGIVDELISIAKGDNDVERKSACARLGQLNEWGHLSPEQADIFAGILWKHVDETTGLPDMNYYYSVYLTWPVPNGIDVKARVRDVLTDGKQAADIEQEFSISTSSDFVYIEEIRVLNEKVEGVFWQQDDVEMLFNLFIRLWRKIEAEFKAKDTIYEFTQRNFQRLGRQLVQVMASFEEEEVNLISEKAKDNLIECFEEMETFNIPSFEAEILFMSESEKIEYADVIIDNLYHYETQMTVGAARALEKVLYSISDEDVKKYLLSELAKVIRARKEPGLSSLLISAHNIFYKAEEPFPESFMNQINKAITMIAYQTDYREKEMTASEIKRNAELRSWCASLVYQIYCYDERMSQEHSEGVLLWKDICTGFKSELEFTEIKNKWLT
ncbi:hypothetical protein NXH76_03175 [Blautia schinkii]|nr:hypothetical protein [Blautia schinkii]